MTKLPVHDLNNTGYMLLKQSSLKHGRRFSSKEVIRVLRFLAYICIGCITPKALLCFMQTLESSLVLVVCLRVTLIGVSQSRQTTVKTTLRQAVNFIIHLLQRITESQRVTILICIWRMEWPCDKKGDSFTKEFKLYRAQRDRLTTLSLARRYRVFP